MYPAEHVNYVVDIPKDLKIERVAFLGGASWKPEDQVYKDAFETAKLLAQNGYEILNGGGPGVMEASTRGAKAGGQDFTVVVTYHPSHEHKNYEDSSSTNPYDEDIITTDYFDRTKVMLQNTDLHIVFKGGTGTISEFGMSWASSRIHEGHHKPIILFGDFWHKVLAVIKENMYMRPGEAELLKICTEYSEVLDYIKSISVETPKEEINSLI